MQVDLRDVGSISGSGRPPGGGHGNPLQCSCLKNPMERGIWQAAICGVAKSRTQLIQLSMHTSYNAVLKTMSDVLTSFDLWLSNEEPRKKVSLFYSFKYAAIDWIFVSSPPQIRMLKTNLWCDGIWGWDFGEVYGSWRWSHHDWN